MAAYQQGDGLWLKVVDRGSEEHLGVVAAHLVERDLEVGVWITPGRRSTGSGQEALLAGLPGLRRRFPAQQVVAEADVDHAASDRLLRSVGFRRSHQRAGRYGNAVHHYVWDETATGLPDERTPGALTALQVRRGSAAAIRTTASRSTSGERARFNRTCPAPVGPKSGPGFSATPCSRNAGVGSSPSRSARQSNQTK